MTSIKPPTSPSTPVPSPADAADGGAAPQSSPEVEGAAATAPGQPADPIAALAADIQAGRIDINQAVQLLVERTVARMGGQLSADERAGLGAILREALESDPVLSSLR